MIIIYLFQLALKISLSQVYQLQENKTLLALKDVKYSEASAQGENIHQNILFFLIKKRKSMSLISFLL